jgi:hypothetical protein
MRSIPFYQPGVEKDRSEKRHNHGRMFRCKIVPFNGPAQYGEWLGSELEVSLSRRSLGRKIGERYYCEAKTLTCPECHTEESPKVISAILD